MQKLLSPNDPAPFEVYNQKALDNSNYLIICDHASNVIPKALGDMGISEEDRNRHIAWDIGAKDIATYLADHLGAPALLAGFSRLVIDVNRIPGHKKSIPETSDKTDVPANQNLTETEKQQRIDEIYTPYHNTFADALAKIRARGEKPFVISIHSFTPQLKEDTRQTEIGILWDHNKVIAQKMIETLKAQNPEMTIGSNDPYSFVDDPQFNHSLHNHDIHKSTEYMLAEFRQDLVANPDQAHTYAEIFLKAFRSIR